MSNNAITPTVTVIGCGYVGLTTAAILANCGVTVYAVEINQSRLSSIKQGKSFFYEEGIDRLIATGLASKRLIPTGDYAAGVPESGIVFSCVGTPDNDDGSSNLSYVYDAARRAISLMDKDAVFVQKSTVPVGTGKQLQTVFRQAGKPNSYVSNPEFLREGTAIGDTLWFDRVVVGSDDPAAGQQVAGLYRLVEKHRDTIAKLAGLTPPAVPPAARYITTGQESAELIKVSSNAFLALKISFANSIAMLADQTGADTTEVMDAVGADRRIGRAFLNAGRGYGGGCFPKDVSSLIRSAEDHGVKMEVMRAVADVNQSMPHYVINKATNVFGRSFEGSKVAVLGVAFKAGTSDVRRSPGITIANTLAAQGAIVSAHDPAALEEADELHDTILRCDDIRSAVDGAEAIFITTDWPEFVQHGIDQLAAMSGAKLIVDAMNCLDKSAQASDVTYIGVGR